MTNGRKIELLEATIKDLQDDIGFKLGICNCIFDNATNKEQEIIGAPTRINLQDFHIAKTKYFMGNVYYFPLNKAGHAERIKACQKAVRILKKQKL